MLKKWKKTIKLVGTTVIVLIYVTTGLFSSQTLKGDDEEAEEKKNEFGRYLPSVQTVVGYSEEFRQQKDLHDRIGCEAEGHPPADTRESTWKSDPKLGLHVFSAFLDERQDPHHYVRIIGLVRRNSSFYCQIWYDTNNTITQKATVQEVWSPSWGANNKTCGNQYPAIISCAAPSLNRTQPSWVSFVDGFCSGSGTFVKIFRKPDPPPKKKNFVICVKPFDRKDIHRRDVLEWMDINFRLGADKIVIYGVDAMVFRNKNQKAVEQRTFTPPRDISCPTESFEDFLWHKRKMEIIVYNDCFYSNLYRTKFVIPLDLDEIIVPKTGNDWSDAFRLFHEGKSRDTWPRHVDEFASFSVRNAYFFPEYPEEALLTLPKSRQKKLVTSLSPFDRTLRSRLSPGTDSVKSFVHVGNTLSVTNHYAFHVLGKARRQLVMPEEVFLLHHYRKSCDPVLIDGCREFLSRVVYDDSLDRFRKKKVL